MPQIEVEGVGRIQVDDKFLGLSPEEQAREADRIIDRISSESFDEPAADRPRPEARATAGGEAEASAPEQMLEGFQSEQLAASQRTAPIVRDPKGNFVRPVLGVAVEKEGGGIMVDDGRGNLTEIDTENNVVLLDPVTRRHLVFERTEDTNEGALTSLGRIVLPGLIAGAPTRLPSAVRGATRGGQMVARGQRVTEAAERQGIDVTLPTASQSRVVKSGAGIARETPVASGIMQRGIERETRQVAGRADELAGDLSNVTNRETAGASARRGLEDFRESAGKDFDLRGVDDPALGQFIAQPSRRSSFSKKAAALYERVNRRVTPGASMTPQATVDELNAIRGRFDNPQLQEQFENSFFGQLSRNLQGPQSWRDLRQLRSEVRQLKARELTDAERTVSNADIKRLESALTRDIKRLTAQAGGPEAVRALERADQFYRAGQARLDATKKLLRVDRDEALFDKIINMAGEGGQADIKRLNQARRSMGEDAWKDVGAVAIRRLGRPTPSAADAATETATGELFSPGSFFTRYSQLSDKGRAVLFGKIAPHLDDLAEIASSQKQTARFSVPTGGGVGIGRQAGQFGVAGAGIAGTQAGLTGIGLIDGFMSAALAVGGAAGLAKLMTSPQIVRGLVNIARASRAKDAGTRLPTQLQRFREALGRTEFAPVADDLVPDIKAEQTETVPDFT